MTIGTKTTANVTWVDNGANMRWQITAQNASDKTALDFKAPKSKMLKIDYENPLGKHNHNALWNTGHAAGTITICRATLGGWKLKDQYEAASAAANTEPTELQ